MVYIFIKLEGIIQQHILPSQLEQHRIVEELVDGDVLGQAFASSGLQHKFSGEMSSRLRLQRSDSYALVQRIAGHDLPMMEDGQAKRLTLGVRP